MTNRFSSPGRSHISSRPEADIDLPRCAWAPAQEAATDRKMRDIHPLRVDDSLIPTRVVVHVLLYFAFPLLDAMRPAEYIPMANERHWALLPEHLDDVRESARGTMRLIVKVDPAHDWARQSVHGSREWMARTPDATADQIKRYLLARLRHGTIAHPAGALSEDDETKMDSLLEGWNSPAGRLLWL